jgi:nicotinate-nucleotide pyrophosphorylase (carboxylating)
MWEARILLKQPGTVAGLPIAAAVWQQVAELYSVADWQWQAHVKEGTACESGTEIATIRAPAAMLLMGERVALNQLAHLSGIATLTRTYTAAIADLPAQLVDTRKTRPGWRLLEKYAVAVGGGVNHRCGLDDAAMVKDNHILAAGSITAAVEAIRAQAPFTTAVEVEAETLAQVQEAIACGADIVMLDNMGLEEMSQALSLIGGQAKTEASGNITLERLRAIAELGVDYISTSATITQATWLDLSLDFQARTNPVAG